MVDFLLRLAGICMEIALVTFLLGLLAGAVALILQGYGW